MPAQTYQLQLKITGDGKDAVVELENVADASEKVEKKTKKASKGVKILDNAVEKSKSNMKAWAASAVAAAVALPTVVALNLAKAAIKNAAEVRRLTQSLNINATALTQWQFASETVGISGEKMADIFKDINDRVGDYATTGAGPLVDVMEQTNLQIEDLINLSPDQQLLKIYDALDKIDGITHAEKTFYLEALAGDASLLIPLLNDGAAGFDKLAQKADDFGVTLSQLDVEKLHIANQQFGIMGHQIDGVGNQLAIGLAPAFYAVMQSINSTALANGGWGDIAKDVAESMVDGLATVLDAIDQVNRGYLVSQQFANNLAIKALKAAEVLGADNNEQIVKLMFKDVKLQTKIANSQLQSSGQVLRDNFDKNKASFEAQAQAAIKLRDAQKEPDDNPKRILGKNNVAGKTNAIKKSQADQAKATKKAADEIAKAEQRKAAEAERTAQRIRDSITSINQGLEEQIIRYQQGDEAAERYLLKNKAIRGAEQDAIIVKQNLIKQLELQKKAQDKVAADKQKSIDAIDRHNKAIERTYNKLTMLPPAYAEWALGEELVTGKIAQRILAQEAANDALAAAQQQQADFAKSFEDDFLASIKNGKLDFSGFVDHIIDEMLRMQVIKPIMDSIFGSTTAGGGRAGGGLFDGFMSLFGFHEGGIAGAGEQTFTRTASIPRYHSGGIVQPGEVPAILQKDEGVFTQGQMRAMAPVQPLVQAITNSNTITALNVVIENKTGVEFEKENERQDSDGTMRFDLVQKQLERGIARNIDRGDSPITGALQKKLRVG